MLAHVKKYWILKESEGILCQNQQVRKCKFLSFFIGVDEVSVLVCDVASDSHVRIHPGAYDILFSLLFMNTFNAN